MSGLLALLDDIAALAKVAAVTIDDAAAQAVKAGSKTAGVLIDDAAVTPRYVTGLAAKRELPIIWRITKGSLRNKFLILLPVALLLTYFLPQAITPLLMLGGLYLCFEGYEKVHHMLSGHTEENKTEAAAARLIDAKQLEDKRVAGAIRTDFILSAEIMAIALSQITAPDLLTRALVLAVVALFVTVLVYGAVAIIVKADDYGVYLAKQGGALSAFFGRLLVRGMPTFLELLSFIGMIAMLWVGGGILLHGLSELGFAGAEHWLNDFTVGLGTVIPGMSGILSWLGFAAGAALFGLVVGGIAAALYALIIAPLISDKEPLKH